MKKICRGIFLFCFLTVFTFVNSVPIQAGGVECPYCHGTNYTFEKDMLTCTSDSRTYLYCNDCNKEFNVTILEKATGHNFIKTGTTPASCTSDGVIHFECDKCSETKDEIIKAKGHSYTDETVKEASCTEDGTLRHICQNCAHEYDETIPKLGHDLKKTITKKVSCTEDGVEHYACSRCSYAYDKTVEKLGHNYKETEKVEATCTSDGYILSVCQNCKDEQKEILSKFGHKVELKVKTEATCTAIGIKSGICETCGEEIIELISPTGHSYPEEWSLEKEAGFFNEGLESRTCSKCGEKEEQVIPKEEIPVAAEVGAGGAVTAGILFLALKKAGILGAGKAVKKTAVKVAEDSVKKVAEEVIEKEVLEPSFEEKIMVTCLYNSDFYKMVKANKYISVIEAELNEITEAVSENEPVLTLIDFSNTKGKKFASIINKIRKENEDASISIIVSKETLQKYEKLLKDMKEKGEIKNYLSSDISAAVCMVKLVLPVMKPDLKSDESLENIGMVADALGIPAVSTLISAYVSGREIKETIAEADGKLSFADKSLIISDIASILGYETASSVTGLITDADDIKSSLESKVGSNEVMTIKDAASDIVDVVSDVIQK